jgi:hypothetical protein
MSMSNKRNTKVSTIGTGMRLPVIPFKRIFKDKNRYDRKAAKRESFE